MKIVLLLCLIFLDAQASDFDKEKRWADQIVDALLDGDAVWLHAEDNKFLGIYTEAETASGKGMIVVHGTGIHPNWDQVVQPVRVEMTTYGWNTLSIQMPILANDATYEDYVPLYPEVAPRIQAAESYLRSQGSEEVVIVAHSQGATMSSYYLANHDSDVSAFIAIGMGATQKDSHLNSAESLKKISIPVLDLFGSEDLPGVLETRIKRQQGANNNPAYKQQAIDGAGHFFDGYNDQLLDAVNDWLSSQ